MKTLFPWSASGWLFFLSLSIPLNFETHLSMPSLCLVSGALGILTGRLFPKGAA
jgi:hypothetical protein